MAKYEYKVVEHKNKEPGDIAALLEVEGTGGWECVDTHKESKDWTFVFKRRVK